MTAVTDRLDDPADVLYGLDAPPRMRVLASVDLDDPDLRAKLDAISARTAARLNLPLAMVTLVFDTAQVIAGSHGVGGWIADAGGTPVEWSFCAHLVAGRRPYVVPDAAADPVHATNPLVTIDGIGSYAGVPITLDGYVLGGHCIADGRPHDFTDADLAELRRGADEITAVLQQHRLTRPAE
jgi:GAF domain-containing protein